MISAALLSLFIVFCSFTVHVNSQTCSGSYPYAPCSSNSACGCLPLSFADDIGICALLGANCGRLSPCRPSDHSCENPNHICVQHPQCGWTPLCYPLVMIDQRLCPSTVTPPPNATTTFPTTYTTTMMMMNTTTAHYSAYSSYYGVLNDSSPVFFRPYSQYNMNGSNLTNGFFFEAYQLVVYETGVYNISSSSQMDTYGYLYQWDFSSFNATNNLIAYDDDTGMNGQFSFAPYLQAGYTYIVVVTTYQPNVKGPFDLIVRGPHYVTFIPQNFTGLTWNDTNTTQSNVSLSYYNSMFDNSTNTIPGLSIPYQIIHLFPSTSGLYNITGNTNMDLFSCLYLGTGDLLSQNVSALACNNTNNATGQFQILTYLNASSNYSLLIYAPNPGVNGYYWLVTSGPDYLYMTEHNTTSTTTTMIMTTTNIPFGSILSFASGFLTNNSESFMRPNAGQQSNYFFEAFEVMVNQSGLYNLSSSSNMDTYGYLYEWNFSPINPIINLVKQDDDRAGNGQFSIEHYLYASVRYILVATSYAPGATGPFQVVGSGPAGIDFFPFNSSSVINSTAPFSTVTTTMITSTAQATNITASYSGELTQNSTAFIRSRNSSADFYYYQAIRVQVGVNGSYNLFSESTMDTYGYLYEDSFSPIAPEINLIASDDDSRGNRQFSIGAYLQASKTYVLVFTTFSPLTYGTYTIRVEGPSSARLS